MAAFVDDLFFQVTSCGAAQVYELKNTTGGRISARLFVPQQGGSSGEIELLIEAGVSCAICTIGHWSNVICKIVRLQPVCCSAAGDLAYVPY